MGKKMEDNSKRKHSIIVFKAHTKRLDVPDIRLMMQALYSDVCIQHMQQRSQLPHH